MTTPDPYQPHISIGGRSITEGRGSRDLAAVSNIKIKWGGDDWWSNVDAALLTVTLIDRRGEFLDGTEADGQPIRITRDDPARGKVVIFDGTVETMTSELTTINNPKTGEPDDVWMVTITGKDPLARMADNRRHGPKYAAPAPADTGDDWHWGPCKMRNRKQDLNRVRSAAIDWETSAFDQFDDAQVIVIMPVPGYGTNQNVSALTVLRQTARISHPFNRPYYDPNRRLIDFVRPPSEADAITFDHGKVTAPGLSAAKTELLDGGLFPARNGVSVSSDALEQVSRIELQQRSNIDITSGTTRRRETDERATVFEPLNRTVPQLTVSLDTDYGSGYDLPGNWGLIVFQLLTYIYGRQSTGPLTWSLAQTLKRAPERAQQYTDWFLTPFPPMTPAGDRLMTFGMVNSLTNWAPRTGPFCIVGGSISYDRRGWQAELNPAQIPRTGTTSDLTLMSEITSPATLSTLPTNRLLADWSKADRN